MATSSQEAEKFTSINSVLDWVGMIGFGPGEARRTFLDLFGWSGTEHPRLVAAMKTGDFEQLLRRWRLGVGDAWKEPLPVQLSQAALVGRACRLACGVSQGGAAQKATSERKPVQEDPRNIAFVIYAKPSNFEIVPASVSMFRGQYREHSWNHGKCVYRRIRVKGQEFLPEAFLFFWDERQGKELSGWYCGSDVGAGQVWAWNPSVLPLPPRRGWRCPADGPELNYISCVPPVRPVGSPFVKQESESDDEGTHPQMKKMRVKLEEEEEMSTENAWSVAMRVESEAEAALEFSRGAFAEASMRGKNDFDASEILKEHARRLEEAAGRLNHNSCVMKGENVSDSEELQLLAKKMQIMLGDVQDELDRQSKQLEYLKAQS